MGGSAGGMGAQSIYSLETFEDARFWTRNVYREGERAIHRPSAQKLTLKGTGGHGGGAIGFTAVNDVFIDSQAEIRVDGQDGLIGANIGGGGGR